MDDIVERLRAKAKAFAHQARREAREAVIEECAKAVEAQWTGTDAGFILCGDTLDHVTKAIRALKRKGEQEDSARTPREAPPSPPSGRD